MYGKASTILAGLLFSCLSLAHTSVQTLNMNAEDLNEIRIDTRAGDIVVIGGDTDEIEVELIMEFSTRWNAAEAEDFLDAYLVFDLQRRGDGVFLRSYIDDDGRSGFRNRDFPYAHLEVSVPARFAMELEDGSGNIIVSDLSGPVSVRDGSGNMELYRIRNDLSIDDGSGNIRLDTINGNLRIDDGSGNIRIEEVEGNLRITDGSGNLSISDVRGDVRVNDGSGNIRLTGATGTVVITDGSGNVTIGNVDSDVSVSSSSGNVSTRNILGRVQNN